MPATLAVMEWGDGHFHPLIHQLKKVWIDGNPKGILL